MKKRFGVLRLIAWVFRILGALVLIAALIAAIAGVVAGFTNSSGALGHYGAGWMMGFWSGFYFLLVGLFSGIMLYGAGEVIELLLAIEENTRAMRQPPEPSLQPPAEE